MSQTAMSYPQDPLSAATHPDPYPYYARLVAERPFYRDERLGLWVASSAAAVLDVLGSDICHVRPAAEPVPRALLGSPAGEIFRQLVRMNDGEGHCPMKHAVLSTLDGIDLQAVSEAAEQRAAELARTLAPRDRAALTRFTFTLPVETIATLLGVPAIHLSATTDDVAAFVAGISPIADAAAVARAHHAAARLIGLFRELLLAGGQSAQPTLLHTLAKHARGIGRGTDDLVIMNGIGFMSQTYEATAGLIGNTLVALARRPEVLEQVRAESVSLQWLIDEVLRDDPPTQSTRRFVVRPGTVAGITMQAGEAILVMLAAAGRDPAFTPEPDRADLARQNRRQLNFGSGVHACPAHKIAPLIARIGIARLLSDGIDFDGLDRPQSYRRSNHVRMPLFA